MTRISEAVECLESLGYTVTPPAGAVAGFRGIQGPLQDLVPVPKETVALLRFPMPIDALVRVTNGLEKLYRDPDLVIRTDVTTADGWMVLAHRGPLDSSAVIA